MNPNKRNGPPAVRAPSEHLAYELSLYIAGQSPKSVRAVENLREVCEEHLRGRYRLELIDLLENPKLARRDGIIAVPTLVRKLPEPIRKIIGDLTDAERLLVRIRTVPEGGHGDDR